MTLAFAISIALPIQAIAATRNYDYTVQLVSKAQVQGKLRIGKVDWLCQEDVCTARGPWPTPSAGACNALAKKAGPVMSYGHPGKHLGRSGLTACNKGVSVAKPSMPLSSKHVKRVQTLQKSLPAKPAATSRTPVPVAPTTNAKRTLQPSTPVAKLNKPEVLALRDARMKYRAKPELGKDPDAAISGTNPQLKKLPTSQQLALPNTSSYKAPLPAQAPASIETQNPIQKIDPLSLRDARAKLQPKQQIGQDPDAGISDPNQTVPQITKLQPLASRPHGYPPQQPIRISPTPESAAVPKLDPSSLRDASAKVNVGNPGLDPTIKPTQKPTVPILQPLGQQEIRQLKPATADTQALSSVTPNIPSTARINPGAVRKTLNERALLEQVQSNCGVNFGAHFTVLGQRLGNSQSKRSVAIIADGGQVKQILSTFGWSESRISVQTPLAVRQGNSEPFIGIIDNQQRLISNVIAVRPCHYNLRVTGNINTRNCDTSEVYIRAVPINDKLNPQRNRIANAFTNPSNDLALAYEFPDLHSGKWRLEPVFQGSGCDNGVWTPGQVYLVLEDAQATYRQDFTFTVAEEIKTVPIGILTVILSQHINDLEVHLNNYNANATGPWHQGYASYMRWPSAGRFQSFNIPEISKTLKVGEATGGVVGAVAGGPVGFIVGREIGGDTIGPTKVFFYINDLNLPPRSPSERTVSVENGQFKIRLTFEGDGTEIKGRCQGHCPFGSDSTVPDADFKPVIDITLTPVRVLRPEGHSVTFGAVVVSAANSQIQINGACEIADICNQIYPYRDRVKQEIEERIRSALDNGQYREKVAKAIRGALTANGVGQVIGEFHVDARGLRIIHVPKAGQRAPTMRGGT